jgi:hypothetical protein
MPITPEPSDATLPLLIATAHLMRPWQKTWNGTSWSGWMSLGGTRQRPSPPSSHQHATLNMLPIRLMLRLADGMDGMLEIAEALRIAVGL